MVICKHNGSYNRKNYSPLDTMSKEPSIETPSTARVGSPSTQQCKGTSVSTGKPCKRTVVSDNYCYQHKDQITRKNIFGIRNDSQENISEIENQMNSLSLNNSEKGHSKIENNESTMITIKLNKLKVQITETEELSKKSTKVSISSEDNRSKFDSREQTPPPIRSNLDRIEFTPKKILSSSTKWVQTDIEKDVPPQDRFPIESPACIDDSFLETTNKESFQTPNLVTPSNELILAPLLSISPSRPKSPLDSLFEMFNSQKTPCNPPSTPTPPRTHTLSYVNTSYESHELITNEQNTTPGSITPTRSRTGDYYSPSSYNSPSNLCQGRIKNGKICNRRIKPSEELCSRHKKVIIEQPIEEELEKAVFVPGRARLTYLRFGDWIKPDLPSETRPLLRSEMEKPVSDKDEPGFIYAYRLLKGPNSEKNSQYTLYKVGRSTNVHRRLYQWAKQCGYTPELIELFPKDMISSEICLIDREENEGSSLNFDNQSESVPKCKYTHRAERLIHIELGARFKADIEKCKNCGNLHREWFKVQNLDSSGTNENEMIGWKEVRKVIVHWITYVERVYGVG